MFKKNPAVGGEYGSSNCMYGSEKEMINMANKVNTTSKLILKVYKGDEKNPDATVQRTFSHINPGISDDVVYSVGMKLSQLQSRGLVGVIRTDSSVIAE